MAEPAGVRHVRAAADVAEARRVVVDAHETRISSRGRVVGLAGDDLELVLVRGEPLRRVGLADLVTDEGLLLGDDLAHPRVDAFEVVGSERAALGQIEVVVEAVFDRRPDAERGPGEQVEHRLREDVRGRVAKRVPTPVGGGHDDLDAVAVDQHPVEVSLDPVDHGDDCIATESRPDRLGETSGRRARGDLSGRAVGEHDVDEVSHREREPTGDAP